MGNKTKTLYKWDISAVLEDVDRIWIGIKGEERWQILIARTEKAQWGGVKAVMRESWGS